MLNPMSTAEVVRAVGAVLEASAAGGSDDEYRRGQVLSAFSVCRHLAAEEEGRRGLAEWLEAARRRCRPPSPRRPGRASRP